MSAGTARVPFDSGPYYRLALLEFTLPLLILLPVRYGFGEQGGLSLEIFLAGTGLELILCFALAQLRLRDLLGPRRFAFYDFLVRLVVGLPFTVYLIVSAPYSIIGLLRFFPLLAYFLERGRFRFALQYLLFFIPGALLFSVLKDFPYPGKVQTVTIVASLLLGGLLYLRETAARRAELKSLGRERDRRRLTRRLEHAGRREQTALEAMMPPYFARLFREDRKLHPEADEVLAVLFRFPDLHESLRDFAESVDAPTREKGLDAFAGEWNRFISYVLDAARKKQYLLARHGEALFCARRLSNLNSSGTDTAQALREETFRLLFWVQEVLRYADRTRRAFQTRGRRGWQVQAGLARGEATGMPQGGGSPAWMMVGPAARELETFLWSAPADPAKAEAPWLQPALGELVHDCFEEGSGHFYHGWYSPGYLLKDLSMDESGILPAEDFFDRLKYKED